MIYRKTPPLAQKVLTHFDRKRVKNLTKDTFISKDS